MNIPVLKLKSHIAPISFQDLGRRGMAKYGVARSGVMDKVGAMYANRLVGNYSNEVLIEFAFGGVEFEVLESVSVAIVGAGGLQKTVNLKKGEVFKVPAESNAVWGYIAIFGGWNVEPVMGSCSFHDRSGVGQLLRMGDVISSRRCIDLVEKCSFVRLSDLDSLNYDEVLRVRRGPHVRELNAEDVFTEISWKVSQQMDRTGYRLLGGLPEHDLTMKSFPVIPGCIQLTPSGQAIVVMPDGPTVGGYPVVAIVESGDLSILAQRVTGSVISFKWNDSD